MAKQLIITPRTNILITLSTLLITIPIAYPTTNPVITPYDRSPICRGPQRSSKIQFYVHDILTGPNQSVYEVANSSITDTSPSRFGATLVVDSKLTRGPDYDSREVGRVQGFAVSGDLRVLALELSVNLLLTIDEYYGSTLAMLGRNEWGAEIRELSIVGGTGMFRCARGYAVTTTYSNTSDSLVFYFEILIDHVAGGLVK